MDYRRIHAGIVTSASHPRVDTIAQVRHRVKKMIEAAEKVPDGEVRAALVEKGYEELRGCARSRSSRRC